MSETPRRFEIRTLGCKANLADSLELSRELQSRGFSLAEGSAAPDLCIVNSCTVTDEADRQSRKLASRLARLHPEARVVITGCAAEVDPERLTRSAGIHYVIGNRDKARLADLVLEALERPSPAHGEVLGGARPFAEMASRHPIDREWPLEWESEASVTSGNTRAFLKVQEGCNAFCTYCIIPYGRGPSRSLEPREVTRRVAEACASGVRELVLTGTNLGDYGVDLGLKPGLAFETLISDILNTTPLQRLRLSSLDPTEISPHLLKLIQEEARLCPHFHVSLQSPVDRVLRLMKRKYGSREARHCLEEIAALSRAPFVGMDLITGFPGESADDFEETLRFLEETPWNRLHVFPYSERNGTPATRLPGSVPPVERTRRARLLAELSLARLESRYERKKALLPGGVLSDVLFERARNENGGEWMMGFSPDYFRVRVPAVQGLRNRIAGARVRGIRLDRASGEALFEGDLAN